MRPHRPVALILAGFALTACGHTAAPVLTPTHPSPVVTVTVTARAVVPSPRHTVTVTATPSPTATARAVTPTATRTATPTPTATDTHAADVACHAVEPLVNAWANGVLPADPSKLGQANVDELTQALAFVKDNIRAGMTLDGPTRVLMAATAQDGQQLQAAAKLGDPAQEVIYYEAVRADVAAVARHCSVDTAE